MNQIISGHQASNAYRRLQFDQFDAPQQLAEQIPAEAEVAVVVEAAPEADVPFEIAPGVPLPTLEEVERITTEAHREGYAAGYDEGSARGRLEAAELHQLVQGVDEALGALDQTVAEELRALAIEVARQVVRETLSTRPEVILAVIREALQSLPQQSASLRVNPEDALLARRYLADHYEGLSHRIVEDAAVLRGGCMIESAGGQIDAQVETRWRRVVENLSKTASEFLDE